MSIQSSINQMLSSIANQQLFKGLTTKVKEIKSDTGTLTDEQKRLNELIQKHGGIQKLTEAADVGQTTIEDRQRMDEMYPPEDEMNADDWFGEPLNQVAATRVTIQQNSARRTNETIAQRLQKVKAERSQSKQEFLKNKGGKHR